MHLLKRLGVVLLVASLVLPFAGTWTWLRVERMQIRKAVKKQIIAGMDKNDLVLLQFSMAEAAALDWHHSEEFGYKGEMYDIVYRESCGDSVLYWCWHDIRETAINEKVDILAQNIGQNTPDSNAPGQHLLNFIKTMFVAESGYPTFHTPGTPSDGYHWEDQYLSLPCIAPPTPPPDVV